MNKNGRVSVSKVLDKMGHGFTSRNAFDVGDGIASSERMRYGTLFHSLCNRYIKSGGYDGGYYGKEGKLLVDRELEFCLLDSFLHQFEFLASERKVVDEGLRLEGVVDAVASYGGMAEKVVIDFKTYYGDVEKGLMLKRYYLQLSAYHLMLVRQGLFSPLRWGLLILVSNWRGSVEESKDLQVYSKWYDLGDLALGASLFMDGLTYYLDS